MVGFHEAVLIAAMLSVAVTDSATVVSALNAVEATTVSCEESELLEHAENKRPTEREKRSEVNANFLWWFFMGHLSLWGVNAKYRLLK